LAVTAEIGNSRHCAFCLPRKAVIEEMFPRRLFRLSLDAPNVSSRSPTLSLPFQGSYSHSMNTTDRKNTAPQLSPAASFLVIFGAGGLFGGLLWFASPEVGYFVLLAGLVAALLAFRIAVRRQRLFRLQLAQEDERQRREREAQLRNQRKEREQAERERARREAERRAQELRIVAAEELKVREAEDRRKRETERRERGRIDRLFKSRQVIASPDEALVTCANGHHYPFYAFVTEIPNLSDYDERGKETASSVETVRQEGSGERGYRRGCPLCKTPLFTFDDPSLRAYVPCEKCKNLWRRDEGTTVCPVCNP
jgi:hypothetical protein